MGSHPDGNDNSKKTNPAKGDVTQDDLQRRFFGGTHRCNVGTTLERWVALKIVVANRPV